MIDYYPSKIEIEVCGMVTEPLVEAALSEVVADLDPKKRKEVRDCFVWCMKRFVESSVMPVYENVSDTDDDDDSAKYEKAYDEGYEDGMAFVKHEYEIDKSLDERLSSAKRKGFDEGYTRGLAEGYDEWNRKTTLE